ncbi:hypothetical protein Cabys_295 [Caldithrix abyssi DSM 13497]|uniref:Uncharacterized protein n=1 Tax=Caldithrix abyssi DSM 13497 TaxID=880073 RepID=A0A1J1C3C3_CALAY|nr:hypothetical protein Cabys_295 [Caldithrix abyssi DSM 13497]
MAGRPVRPFYKKVERVVKITMLVDVQDIQRQKLNIEISPISAAASPRL